MVVDVHKTNTHLGHAHGKRELQLVVLALVLGHGCRGIVVGHRE
jgi:hypothetical protein